MFHSKRNLEATVSYDHWCDVCNGYFHSASEDAEKALRTHKGRSYKHKDFVLALASGGRHSRRDEDEDKDDEPSGDEDEDYQSVGSHASDELFVDDVDYYDDVELVDFGAVNEDEVDDGANAGTLDFDEEAGREEPDDEEGVATTASREVWRMQEQMKMQFEEGCLHARNPRGNKSFKVAALLGGFINDMNLSEAEGDAFLAVVQKVVDYHVDYLRTLDIEISAAPKMELYKTARAVDNLVAMDPLGHFTSDKKVVKLSAWFFGQEASDARPMTWEKVKILPLISWAMLNVPKVGNFKTEFEELRNHRGERVFGPFSSGNVCRDVNRQLAVQFGPNFSGLFISCSYDSAQTSKRAGGSKCPLLFSFYNCESGNWEYYFLGYMPDELPYTAVEANKILIAQGWLSETHRKYILAKELRQQMQKYAVWAFEDLMKFQATGLRLQIGLSLPNQGPPKTVTVVPVMIGAIMDTAANSGASQVAFNNKRMPCRCCETSYHECTQCFLVRVNHAPTSRDSAEDERLSLECSQQMNDHMLNVRTAIQERRSVPRRTPELKELLGDAQARGHGPNSHGRNWWYEWFRLTMGSALLIAAVGFRAKWSMHDSFLIEILHTFGKGIVEDTIGVILMIIQIVAKIDPQYRDNMALLDARMSSAPKSNSLQVGVTLCE